MPGLDKTGPNGEGSKTGRGLGKCNPETKDNLSNTQDQDRPGQGGRFRGGNGPGNGLGRGRGRGGSGRGLGRSS